MTDTNETIVEQDGVDYIAAINELKNNTVDKELYNKMKEENKRLLDTLISGGQLEVEKEKVDMNQLRSDLYGSGQTLSNLDYWKKTMELREAIMETGAKDPFLPYGTKVVPTEEDVAAANRVANGIQHCLDVADGDNLVFTNELQRIMVDTMPIRRRK